MIDDTKRPPVVCICGSGRFWDEMSRQRRKLTLAGKIVIGPEVKADSLDGDNDISVNKFALDALHFHKINICDEVLVVDFDTNNPSNPAYVGDSTRREIAYAEQSGIPVHRVSEISAH